MQPYWDQSYDVSMNGVPTTNQVQLPDRITNPERYLPQLENPHFQSPYDLPYNKNIDE